MTKEIYLSAYRSKQCAFNAYLNGQQKFRWVIECNIEKLEQVVSSYKSGNIPKENINCTRYLKFSEDVKIEDVSKSQRALDHIKKTIKTINEEKDKLFKRKIELYGENHTVQRSGQAMRLLFFKLKQHRLKICSRSLNIFPIILNLFAPS